MAATTNNPMGSVFDQPEAPDDPAYSYGDDHVYGAGEGAYPPDTEEDPVMLKHDPMHGPIRSAMPNEWEQDIRRGPDGKPLDPLHQPATDKSPALPAAPDYMCCLAGCRHYAERLPESETQGERRYTDIFRLCMGFGGEELHITEGTMLACTKYSPPWWSLEGWRRRVIVAHRVLDMRIRSFPRPLTVPERLLEALYKRVKGGSPELPGEQKFVEESHA